MRKLVIITSKFNIMTGTRNTLYGKNESARVTEDWINARMDIFMNYTFKSLINQSNQNFLALYAYEDSTENFIENALLRYPKLPENIKFIKKSLYTSFIDTISSNYDLLFISRLDSDDMYEKNFVDNLLNYPLKDTTEALLCQNGYILNANSNQLNEYYHESFTYYSFVYRIYKEKKKYDSLNVTPWDLLINFFHFSVLNYNVEFLEGRNFIFNIHDGNTDSKFPISSFMWYRLEREITDKSEKDFIFKKFLG